MATAKTENYTAEQTANMVEQYLASPTKGTVDNLATAMGKTTRSVIAKLSREKVYIAKARTTKDGGAPVKKDTVADAIGSILGMTEAETESLTKANKMALNKIMAALANSKPF